MYFQYIQDDELEEVLINKAEEWVKIEIVVDDDFYEKHSKKVQFLESKGISVHKYRFPVMHAKAILVDKKQLFIGSVNFSSYSLDKNRETGIIFSDTKIIEQFLNIFIQDFSS